MKNLITLLLLIFSSNSLFSQSIGLSFIEKADAFFKQNVIEGNVKYDDLKKDNAELESLVSDIRRADVAGLDSDMEQAFYINAYNILVIYGALKNYPLESVQDIGSFFDKKNIIVSGKKTSLNQLEKDKLLNKFGDPRYHFVLVCGAKGCPPITNFAYHPDRLEEQLEQQTRLALNDNGFLSTEGNTLNLSQIFKWYRSDFGGSKSTIVDFINKYREAKVSADSKINYTNYDWSLNNYNSNSFIGSATTASAGGNNTLRYIVSSTIAKGTSEVKIFNNLYTQKTGSPGDLRDRSTFFTTSISALYGLSNRFNIGINTRYRRVRNDNLPSSAFSVLGSGDSTISSRTGFTAFGPQIRYAPVPKWQNFSIQSSFVFPIGNDLAGSATQPYIDWTGPTWNTQFFNDFPIGSNFSLFTEIDFLIEDIGSGDNINRISTPVTAIFSYNPVANMTLYVLNGYSPYWQENYDYFYQYGAGFKYQFTPNFELELLYTDFTNQFLGDTGGQASTFNLGLRFNI